MFGWRAAPVAFRRLLHCVGDAVFPGICMRCDRLFRHDVITRERTGPWFPAAALAPYFCPDCRDRWTAVASPLCSRCGLVFKSREGDDHLCGRCLDYPGAFTRARAAGIYDHSLRIAIHALKFKRRVHLAAPLGELLFHTFQQYWGAGDIDLVAPVPLHRKRLRQRGFNQAYLLVRRWSLPAGTAIVRDLMVRHRSTPPQTGLDRRQRRMNIKKAFTVCRPGESAGKRVLLVDDVLTTGATVDACAHILIKDGAARVDVLTLARAQ